MQGRRGLSARVVCGTLVLALGAFEVPRAEGGEKARRLEIVDRAIELHGGDVYRASDTSLRMCSKSGCSALRARVAGGAFELEAQAEVRSRTRSVVIDNHAVRWVEDGEPREVSSEDEQALRDWVMARVYFVFLPFRLNDPSVWKEDQGTETWEGRELRRVKVTFDSGTSTHAQDEYLYWFDPASARLEMFAYSYATSGGGLRLRRLTNHRRVGGILFFDQENHGVEGSDLSVDQIDPKFAAERMRHVSTIELREIRVDPLP